ncbi:MAG: zinc ribbon domain-containing protein [Methanobrevibacter sp.]|uniref:zinc ribbon domain-containing protein n=1 Tax=Methanobrevibacter sp. TaxID=66852 RepID=UPI0025CE2202|nr:zinc ribbon domain-containing protein [Methanobrevibacter sp.]MBR0270527.1 zinc ribbon domain-containing protein [Methanobrevibacter sp.]
MVKCPRCGYDNLSSSTYCVNCSYILSGSPTGQKKSGWKMGTAKKILLIVGIIVIALLLFSLIYNISQPSNEESLNVVVADNNIQEGSAHPYSVKVNYNGSWYSKSGDPNYPVEKSGNGPMTFSLDSASWDKVSVYVEKTDGSSDPLTVQLLRNGEVVGENSTSDSINQVTISYRS